MDFEHMTPKEIAKAIELISESDVCSNNTMLKSVLLIAASYINLIPEKEQLDIVIQVLKSAHKQAWPNSYEAFEIMNNMSSSAY